MKPIRLTALMAMLAMAFSAVAQEEYFDDVYSFSGTKKSKAKKETIKKQAPQQEERVIASYSDADAGVYDESEIDAYNRRYHPSDTVKKQAKVSSAPERRSDTEYTERIVRYHDPSKITVAGADNVNIYLSDGYYGYGYDTEYSDGGANVNLSFNFGPSWGGFGYYDPWYSASWRYPWYDPFYSWRYPWYSPYSWYPSWSFGWSSGWGWGFGWHGGWYDPWYTPSWGWGGGYWPHYHGPKYHYAPQGRRSTADRYYSGSHDRYNGGRNNGGTIGRTTRSSSVASRLNAERGGSSVVRSSRPSTTRPSNTVINRGESQSAAPSRLRNTRSSSAGWVNGNRTRVTTPAGTNSDRRVTTPVTRSNSNRSTPSTVGRTSRSTGGNTYTAPSRSSSERTYTAPSRSSGGNSYTPSRSSGGSNRSSGGGSTGGGSRSRSGGGGRR